MNVVGVTLIAAALVIPPVAARLLTNSFGRLTVLSVLLGALCGFAGMFVSYYGDIASGPAIILLAAGAFGAIYVVTGVARGLRGRQMAPQRPTLSANFNADPR